MSRARSLPKPVLWALAWSAACGGSEGGARPHDMSAVRHEEAAGAEDERAAAHAAEYDPEATWPSSVHCGGGAWVFSLRGPCWTSNGNPTEAHRAEAERHRAAAAAHRAAAAALREVEARACIGIPDAERDQSPFAHREDIASVTELAAAVDPPATGGVRVVGATIVFRAVPGLTTELLRQTIECHLARNAVLGHDVPEMPYCPLVPPGVSALVRSADGGIAVDVRATSDDAIREVIRRAGALTAP